MEISYSQYYHSNIHNQEKLSYVRLDIIRSAKSIGIKPTSKKFNVSRNTIKKWIKRHKENNYSVSKLKNLSCRPNKLRCPTPDNIKQRIISTTIHFKSTGKVITVNNIRRASKLLNYPISDGTVNRFIRKALNNKSKKVKKSKNGSVAFKKYIKPFELIQVDIKYLDDIPNLNNLFLHDRNMPRYQITARDVSTGQSFISFGAHKGVYETTSFVKRVLVPFFKKNHIDMSKTIIQTDNGNEFTNRHIQSKDTPRLSSFTREVEKHFKKHRINTPGHCSANSEVESFHWSIERDLYGFYDFKDVSDLISKADKYIKQYTRTIIKHRGYSPIQKIKSSTNIERLKEINVFKISSSDARI